MGLGALGDTQVPDTSSSGKLLLPLELTGEREGIELPEAS